MTEEKKYTEVEAWVKESSKENRVCKVIMNNGFQMRGVLKELKGEVLIVEDKSTGEDMLVFLRNVSTIKYEQTQN